MKFSLFLLLSGCGSDQTLIAKPVDSVAVTTGDFDYVAAPLDYLIVAHDSYEGLISTASWSTDYDPNAVSLKVEGLFSSLDEMQLYDVIFVASGTRGFGERVYNGIDPDDAFVGDPAVVENIREYVRTGGILVATDWAYDLVQAAWPDAVDFLSAGKGLDTAQRGLLDTVTANVVDKSLANALDMSSVAIAFNFSDWAVMKSQSSANTTTLMTADIQYRDTTELGQTGGTTQSLSAVPLLISHSPESAGGKVVFSSFHFDAQNREVMDTVLTTVVANFEESDATIITVGE